MVDTKASKASNLARIRDNQRRSRARRKEYLQELEAKLRSCEQMGVEASAEIQSAARKVLEENRKLRGLLRERGVPEADIVAVMGTGDKSFEHISVAPALSTLLERKRPCNGQMSCGSPSGGEQTAGSLMPRTPALPPISIPPPRNVKLSNADSVSPHSIGSSSVETPSGFSNPSFFPVPLTPAPEVSKAENLSHFDYQLQPPLNTPWTFPNETTCVPEPVAYNNASSCVYAANIIRTMRADVGPELEADLGCRILGQDCVVHNTVVFNAMDKYSNPGISHERLHAFQDMGRGQRALRACLSDMA
ncbi:hypothetical protein K469DRAFT_693534 [Zopfia rhizophila CBS 207.26]|uniref:BZIP domain-containing protein n=1 Tax=Zopfia rhizophila CBS 207.26 TaxID=1314779 RepID=A0A6A6DKL8_9PEZI|nr:hypothetical protein K469DRAFT_693534 [Zopfia rhizophila CBS 207.26]